MTGASRRDYQEIRAIHNAIKISYFQEYVLKVLKSVNCPWHKRVVMFDNILTHHAIIFLLKLLIEIQCDSANVWIHFKNVSSYSRFFNFKSIEYKLQGTINKSLLEKSFTYLEVLIITIPLNYESKRNRGSTYCEQQTCAL